MMRYPVTYLRLLARAMRLDDDGLARLVEGTALRVEDLTTGAEPLRSATATSLTPESRRFNACA